jgi:hypothetical protein
MAGCRFPTGVGFACLFTCILEVHFGLVTSQNLQQTARDGCGIVQISAPDSENRIVKIEYLFTS